METNSRILSGELRLMSIVVALFLLPFTAAAQAGNSSPDSAGKMNPGGISATAAAPRTELDVNTKLKIRSGSFFLKNTALSRVLRGHKALASSSPLFDPVVLGTSNANDYLVFNAGGSERARISTDGNVGIGTTSPSGSLQVSTADNSGDKSYTTSNGFGLILNQYYAGQGSPDYLRNADIVASTGDVSASQIRFFTKPTNGQPTVRMLLDKNGNVGIGTTTPLSGLDVRSANKAIDSFGNMATLSTDSEAINKGGQLTLGGKYSSTLTGDAQYADFGTIAGRKENGTDNNYAGYLAFGTIPAGGVNTERMRIDSSGNVGIGTTSPYYRLEASADYNGNDFGQVAATGGTTSTKTMSIGYNTTGDYGFIAALNRGVSYKNIVIAPNGGNVGIGTTSPAGRLHIVGSGPALIVDAGNNADYFALQTLSSTAGVSGRATGASLGNSSAWFGIQTNSDSNPNSGFYVKGTSGSNPVFTVNTAGNVNVTGSINAKYQDVAEWVPSSEQLSAGTVVVLDSAKSNQVTSSSVSYDTRVAGVVSEQPGIALGEKSEGKVLVATTGRVRVKGDATKAPIHIGDLLVTSDIPGVAMKSEPVNLGGVTIHRPGTLIGKALEPLEKGKGEILVLLSLQ